MNDNYNFFCDRVCSYIDHATDKEKRAIHKELSDHIEDHAQALMELGRDETEARVAAIVAMGDPEEIGRELNKEYPLFWLLVSRIALAINIILAVFLIDPVLSHLSDAKANLQARYDPMSIYEDRFTNEIDYRMEIPYNDDIARIFAMDIEKNDSRNPNDYMANIGICIYDKNIFGNVSSHSNNFYIYLTEDAPYGDWARTNGSGYRSRSVIYTEKTIYFDAGQESLYAKYQWENEEICIEIPLDLEGIE